jgi:hypothetical protein
MSLDSRIVLITGGCGQVGLAITGYLQSHHPTTKIHILDLTPPSALLQTITYHTGSITNVSTISSLFSLITPEVVFHTAGLIPSIAARLGLNTEKNFMEVNLEGTRIVLEEAKKAGVKAFIHTSSADVVKGNSWQDLKGVDEEMPIPDVFDSAYGRSKVKISISLCLSLDMNYICEKLLAIGGFLWPHFRAFVELKFTYWSQHFLRFRFVWSSISKSPIHIVLLKFHRLIAIPGPCRSTRPLRIHTHFPHHRPQNPRRLQRKRHQLAAPHARRAAKPASRSRNKPL